MEKCLKTCSICLKSASDLRKVTDNDENLGSSPLERLQSCVREIEWNENYMICIPCNADLNLVYDFREKCLDSEKIRKQEISISSLESTPSCDNNESKTKFKFQCELCDESFKSSTQVIIHAKTQHDMDNYKPFICPICNNRFRGSSNLAQHIKYHNGSRTHICSFCGKGYITRNDLKIHEKIHLNKKDYTCTSCSKSFNTHKDLRSHNWVVHTDSSLWQHVCEICSKRFPVKSNYDAHMRRHKNERPFGCHLCEKKFGNKSILQKHILSHTDYREFACDICMKEYKHERIMNIHKKKVHGIGDIKVPERGRKFLCHMCAKAYVDKNKLTRHLYSHTGEKPHFCHLCSKKFVDKSYLKRHMKKSHNEDE